MNESEDITVAIESVRTTRERLRVADTAVGACWRALKMAEHEQTAASSMHMDAKRQLIAAVIPDSGDIGSSGQFVGVGMGASQ